MNLLFSIATRKARYVAVVNVMKIGKINDCARIFHPSSSTIVSLMARDIKAILYIKISVPAVFAAGFHSALVHPITDAFVNRNMTGAKINSHHHGRIERLMNMATMIGKERIVFMRCVKEIDPRRALPMSMSIGIPDVIDQTNAVTIGHVTHRPTLFPRYTSSIVVPIVMRARPVKVVTISVLIRFFTTRIREFLTPESLKEKTASTRAPQRNNASWRAFRSYQSSTVVSYHPAPP